MVSRILLGAIISDGFERSQAGLADGLQVSALLPELCENLTKHLLLAVLSLGSFVISTLIQTKKYECISRRKEHASL